MLGPFLLLIKILFLSGLRWKLLSKKKTSWGRNETLNNFFTYPFIYPSLLQILLMLLFLQDWYSPDIEVCIKDTHNDTGLCGQVGVVRGVTPGMCSVFLPDEDRTVNIAPDHLQPIQPIRNDKVKVIMGKKLKSFLTFLFLFIEVLSFVMTS